MSEVSRALCTDFLRKLDPQASFPIELEALAPDGRTVWELGGYNRKDNAKRAIEKYLLEGEDYLSLNVTEQVQSANGVIQKREISKVHLSLDGFKQLLMLSGTTEGKQVRRFFIQAEEELYQLKRGALNTTHQLEQAHQSLAVMKATLDLFDIELDARDRLHIKEYMTQLALPPAGGRQGIYNDIPLSRAVQETFNIKLPNVKLGQIGRLMSRAWQQIHGKEPEKHDQYVDGALREVNHYPREWVIPALREIKEQRPDLFAR